MNIHAKTLLYIAESLTKIAHLFCLDLEKTTLTINPDIVVITGHTDGGTVVIKMENEKK